jgi:cytochrome b561
MMNNNATSWGRVARAAHWLMAVLFAFQIGLALAAGQMARSPAKADVMAVHKSLGITLLLLACLRLLWRFRASVPDPVATIARWELRLSRLTHALLYLLMFALPISGWLAVSTAVLPSRLWWVLPLPRLAEPNRGWHELAETSHEVLAWLLVGFLTLHIGAALFHHFARGDEVLRRMWRGS